MTMRESVPPLKSDETKLEGVVFDISKNQWNKQEEVNWRILVLISEQLHRVGNRDGGWVVLYKDPQDGRLWEKTHPLGELQGGGPVVLTCISEAEARERYPGIEL